MRTEFNMSDMCEHKQIPRQCLICLREEIADLLSSCDAYEKRISDLQVDREAMLVNMSRLDSALKCCIADRANLRRLLNQEKSKTRNDRPETL